jgi:hypothetical protein
VKTGSDATRYQVWRSISYTSVGYLDHLTPPASLGSYAQNHRIRWPEFRTWQINGVTLRSSSKTTATCTCAGKGMIAEIPRPGCASSASPWKAGVTFLDLAATETPGRLSWQGPVAFRSGIAYRPRVRMLGGLSRLGQPCWIWGSAWRRSRFP